MKAHHESKHTKLPWDPSLYEDVQAKHGGTTQGVAVRGTTNAKKLKGKNPKADLDDLLAAGLRAGKK
ncbi:expressed unknown protein [Ectocarpus siliculosus]|uniref:Uncharacterized protein n=1 Tax=Ectocarpus siliculosus TaxID=2880 RepID=D7FVH3_ECTSI|nr:expressed unknown protein [Ectocarpus siliculosus]|eukprot:CBJ31894.1 expressed unknown protein [Ectocarpus siliculosus]